MNKRTLGLAALLLTIGAGVGYGLATYGPATHEHKGAAGMASADRDAGPCVGGRAPEYWVAPMDASYRRDAPGKSPMGMDLVPHCGPAGPGGDARADVHIAPQVVQNLGIRSMPVRRMRLSSPVRATGTVGWDEDSLQMIHTRAEGWLEQFSVAAAGDDVAAGQPMYALFSPKLSAAEAEFLAARGNARLRDAAAARLRALGYSDAQVEAVARRGSAAERQARLAPADLTVVALGARQGQFVQPGTHVLTLGDLSRVWLRLQLPQSQAAGMAPGLPAEVTVAAYPGQTWSGEVEHVYPTLDAATRTLGLRLVFDNADRRLRPGMFATAVIHRPVAEEALVVPAQAVIRTGAGARVVKAVGEGAFAVVPVQIGHAGGEQVQILEGLQPGEMVVTSGQFLIDSEANVDAETLRLRAARSMPRIVASASPAGTWAARTIRLEHGPFRPAGAEGMSMPAMTMGFGLAADLDVRNVRVGEHVRVRVENPEPGVYTVTRIAPAPERSAAQPPVPTSPTPKPSVPKSPAGPAAMTRATVVAVDGEHGVLRLRHARIESLQMPPMTMGFAVAEGIDLQGFAPGDAVRFHVERQDDGTLRITRIMATQARDD